MHIYAYLTITTITIPNILRIFVPSSSFSSSLNAPDSTVLKLRSPPYAVYFIFFDLRPYRIMMDKLFR